MATVTLAELRSRARNAADLEGAVRFMKDVELDRVLNAALWALDGKLQASWEDYNVTTLSVALTGDSYTLPTDFLKLLYVDVQGPGKKWAPLVEYSLKERNAYRNSPATGALAQRYRVLGRKLTLLPGLGTNTVPALLAYYPQRPALTLATDTCEYPNGWEQWAVLYAAVVLVTKEERDTGPLERLLALETARVEAEVPNRTGNTTRVVDNEDTGWVDGIAPWRTW